NGETQQARLCPTGKSLCVIPSCNCGVSSPFSKYISLVPSGKSSLEAHPVLTHWRGVAQRHQRGNRMRWTPAALKTRAQAGGRRSRVVLTPRRLVSSRRKMIPPATVAKEPGHRGEHEGNRKTIARGMPDVFR